MMKANPPSTIDVLLAISDKLSIDIITSISNHVTKPDDLMRILKITPKQYYSRSSRLSNLGLVSRRNGEIILTTQTAGVQSAIENRDRILTHFGINDDRRNKITLGDVRSRTEENNR